MSLVLSFGVVIRWSLSHLYFLPPDVFLKANIVRDMLAKVLEWVLRGHVIIRILVNDLLVIVVLAVLKEGIEHVVGAASCPDGP